MPHPGSPELVESERYWRVPGKPEAVIAWIEAHVPAGANLSESRGEESGPGGVMTSFASFSFPGQ